MERRPVKKGTRGEEGERRERGGSERGCGRDSGRGERKESEEGGRRKAERERRKNRKRKREKRNRVGRGREMEQKGEGREREWGGGTAVTERACERVVGERESGSAQGKMCKTRTCCR